jgi:hypothetical protein
MKKISQKLIEADLIDRNTLKLFEMWGTLSAEDVKPAIKKTLGEFVRELSQLMEDELPEMRECSLECSDLIRVGEYLFARPEDEEDTLVWGAACGFDSMGRLVVDLREATPQELVEVEDLLRPGCMVREPQSLEHPTLEIMEYEPRYSGEVLSYFVCTVRNYGGAHADLQSL